MWLISADVSHEISNHIGLKYIKFQNVYFAVNFRWFFKG